MKRSILSRRSVLASSFVLPTWLARPLRPPFAKAPPGWRRGVAIYHMMEGLELTPDRGYVWPPYNGPEWEMQDRWMAELKAVGFDFVRIAIAPDIFLRSTGPARAYVDAQLVSNVTRFLKAGLNVIADLHPGNRIAGYKQADYVAAPATMRAHADLIEQLAGLLARFPRDRVALELLNEPETGAGAWAKQQALLHERARRGSRDLLLVLTGGQGAFYRLTELDPEPYRGSNVMFTFHYYEPHVFTHQDIPDRRYLTHVPWPSDSGTLAEALATASANIARDDTLSPSAAEAARQNARKLLTRYFQAGSGPANVSRDMAGVVDWAKRHGVPRERILVGEFGVNAEINGLAGARTADRDRWLRAVRGTAEANGFGWCLWAYDGPTGMTLVRRPDHQLDPAQLTALGLRPSTTAR